MRLVLGRLWSGEAGGSLVEYALLGVMIAIGVVAAVGGLAHSVTSSISQANAGMTGGSKDGLAAVGGVKALPDHRNWAPRAAQGSSGAATQVVRVAVSVESAAVRTAGEAAQYAKSWSLVLSNSRITGARGAIVAGWTAAIPH